MKKMTLAEYEAIPNIRFFFVFAKGVMILESPRKEIYESGWEAVKWSTGEWSIVNSDEKGNVKKILNFDLITKLVPCEPEVLKLYFV